MFENSTTNGVLRSEAYLTTNHEPESPVGRGSEIQRIAEALKPLPHGNTAENLLVYSPAGVGKTTCVKHVFQRLEQQTRTKAIYINSWQYNTRSSLLTELLIKLGYPAPRKGKPVDELLSKIREWVDKNHNVAITLDEFDQLQERTEIIYDLQLINEEADNEIGLIMVSNQPPQQIQLDPRSQSRLNCHTLQFNPYNAPQLIAILKKRAQHAFKPGTISQKVIEKIAEQVAENSGDCRQALKTLLQTGRKADQDNQKKIELDDINKS